MNWGKYVTLRYLLGNSGKFIEGGIELKNKFGNFQEEKNLGSHWGNNWGGESWGSSWNGSNWQGAGKGSRNEWNGSNWGGNNDKKNGWSGGW